MHLGWSDREVSGVRAQFLLLLGRHLDSLGAGLIRTLADPLRDCHPDSSPSLTALMRSFTSRNRAWFSPARRSRASCSVGMDMLAPRFRVGELLLHRRASEHSADQASSARGTGTHGCPLGSVRVTA